MDTGAMRHFDKHNDPGSYQPSYKHRVYGSEFKKYDSGHEA